MVNIHVCDFWYTFLRRFLNMELVGQGFLVY